MDDIWDLSNMGVLGELNQEEEPTRSEAPDPVRGMMFPNVLQESPNLTFTNTLANPRRMRLMRGHRLLTQQKKKEREQKNYGCKMTPRVDFTMDDDIFRIECARGFCGKAGKMRVGGRITMKREPQIPRDKTFVIHLFIDVSGSMSSSIGSSYKSRIQIVNEAIEQMRDTLKPVVKKGLKVKLSLHTFSKECKECVETVDATSDYLETMDWSRHLRTDSMTNIWASVKEVQQMREQIGNDENHTYIIVSDGEDTCDESRPDGDIKVFDYAIGVGTSQDYDPTILSQIAKNEIEGCPDEQSLSATLLRLGCAEYMVMARDVFIRVNGKLYEVEQWLSGSQVLFTVDIPVESDSMNFTYGMTVGSSGVMAASVKVPLSSLPKRCGMEQRRTVELCYLNEESGEILRRLNSQSNVKQINSMYMRCRRMSQSFEEGTWAHLVASGLEATWRTLQKNIELPAMDRGMSIQSAIRQTSANYYDCQTFMNCSIYSQKAF